MALKILKYFIYNQVLIGEISYIKIFTFIIEDKDVFESFNKPVPKPIKKKSGECGGADILKSTIDQRKCVAPCSRDDQPPSPNAPLPPEEAKIA